MRGEYELIWNVGNGDSTVMQPDWEIRAPKWCGLPLCKANHRDVLTLSLIDPPSGGSDAAPILRIDVSERLGPSSTISVHGDSLREFLSDIAELAALVNPRLGIE